MTHIARATHRLSNAISAAAVLTPPVAVMMFMAGYVAPAMSAYAVENRTTVRYVDYAREASAACPVLAPRMREMLADGRIDDAEIEVMETLIDQARAAPGGLRTCRYHRIR